MSRYKRKDFDFSELQALPPGEAQNHLILHWWCDDGEVAQHGKPARRPDRLRYIDALQGVPTAIPSRALLQDDPAPPLSEPAQQGLRQVYLLSRPEHVRQALTDSKNFSNRPYAALGGASFLLGMDPPRVPAAPDWHAVQQRLVQEALCYPHAGLCDLARRAIDQAALTSLARSDFDLAQFAEQASLRYLGQLFGYGFQDHGLLEDASRATYRALQYLAVGQHFVTEPGTLPAAQQALGRLVSRSSALMEHYTKLRREPRLYGREPARDWPDGVQPWSELGLGNEMGQPLLKALPCIDSTLSGRDRATIAATLLAGTVGNLQSAVCLLVQALLNGPDDEFQALRDTRDDAEFMPDLQRRLAHMPPVPMLPRRTLDDKVELGGVTIPANTDCLLLLDLLPGCEHAHTAMNCPRVWGEVNKPATALHGCLGQHLAMPLIAALVRHTLKLPGIKHALDPLTGEPQAVKRLWGFACTSYPLRFERERQRVQQNLIISMRVKAPISENAMHLRRLITAAVPRIEQVLTEFGHLHFAWFEFSDDDSQLVLRTLYDGNFEAYLQHFALRAGDLFDGLFEHLEGAPLRPVAEHPHDFVETLRRYNRTPLAGYLYSAYPSAHASDLRRVPGKP